MGVRLAILKPDNTPVEVDPILRMGQDEKGGHVNPDQFAVPEIRFPSGAPGVARLDRLDPATHNADISLSLPGENTSGIWVVHAEITYKPWVNLVWIGVLVAVLGIFIAGINRTLEAKKIVDTPISSGGYAKTDNTPQFPDYDDDEDTYPVKILANETTPPALLAGKLGGSDKKIQGQQPRGARQS